MLYIAILLLADAIFQTPELYIVHLKGYQHRRTRNDGEEEDSNFGDSTDDENEDEYYGKRSPARDAFRMPSAQQPSAKMPT